ncbi:tRNA wybutosine-synthesizing protein 2 homolog [Lepisosteus oculatus]|uniref:tRNA wybutosine-synthesizing protein 2 homolog n=1 Tax=Lepisosteus oculatus TaxID=7918 RepID=UPI003721CC37
MDVDIPAVTTPVRFAQSYRRYLEEVGALDRRFCLQERTEGLVALPILPACLAQLDLQALQRTVAPGSTCCIAYIRDPVPSKRQRVKSAHDQLAEAVQGLLEQRGEQWSEELRQDLPHSWQRHGDLVLLGEGCFLKHIWSRLEPELWGTVALALGGKRLARMGRVSADSFRSPAVTLLLGEDSWVTHVDNGIRYEFDVTKCMFSPGNITEKLRIASLDCSGETVVDLYAGIGYFTIPYLVCAGAARVHACEWNPHAVAALRRNLQLNGVSQRCTVHQGDSRQLQLGGGADRVNLGLIPSSEEGWPAACRLLRQDRGGVLHVHQNVSSRPPRGAGAAAPRDGGGESGQPPGTGSSLRREWREWAEDASRRIAGLLLDAHGQPWRTRVLHVEHVKSYAPHVDHLVLDLECRPV